MNEMSTTLSTTRRCGGNAGLRTKGGLLERELLGIRGTWAEAGVEEIRHDWPKLGIVLLASAGFGGVVDFHELLYRLD